MGALGWLRRQPGHIQVLVFVLVIEWVRVCIIEGDMLPAFWRGLTGQ